MQDITPHLADVKTVALAEQGVELAERIATSREDFMAQREALGRRLRILYMKGRTDDLRAVLTADNVSDLLARVRMTRTVARVQAAVDALRPVVAKIRGLAWKKPVKAAVMSRAALREFMLTDLAKEVTPEEWARDNRILRRLGLLSEKEDLKAMVAAGVSISERPLQQYHGNRTIHVLLVHRVLGIVSQGALLKLYCCSMVPHKIF